MAKENKLIKWGIELLRYVVDLGAIGAIWVPVMNLFGTSQWQVWETLAVALGVFIIVDKVFQMLVSKLK